MSLDAAFGLAVITCFGMLIFGLVKRFPRFIIQGSITNCAAVVLCAYLLTKVFANFTHLGGVLSTVLIVPIIAFGVICTINLRNFLSGREAENFYELIRREIRLRLAEADDE